MDFLPKVVRSAISWALVRGKASKTGQSKGVQTADVGERLKQTDSFAKNGGDQLFVYRDGTYVPLSEADAGAAVKRVLEERGESKKWKGYLVTDVMKYLKTDAPELPQAPASDSINVSNGVLVIESRTLVAHAPSYVSTVRIPIRFDEGATCPNWDDFIAKLFPGDAIEFAWELIGWTLVPSTVVQKAVLLFGEGGNGKSTFLELLGIFLGRQNVSHVTLQDLTSNRFASAQLVNKLANICADLPSTKLQDAGLFKAVTGGDTIQVERKFQPSFSVKPFAKLIFSSNSLPGTPDNSRGYFDRWVIVPFTRRLRGTSREITQSQILSALGEPNELSGALNKALSGLDRVRERGGFNIPTSCLQAVREYRSKYDPVGAWLEERTEECVDGMIEKEDLLKQYSESKAGRGVTPAQMGKAVHSLYPSVKDGKKGPKGEQVPVYRGIRLVA